ncbi:MAG: SDR family NAD(P)-dependent oxidoreductase [Acidimicrobiia bacterium]|nr:SDR family NAD(P)-dependent oxidoreductase [Acidimicrobiia bacterium]
MTERDGQVEERVAVITGASQGLGFALAEELASRGWRLVLDARRADRLDRAAGALHERTTVEAIAGDVTEATHRQALLGAARKLGRMELLVNNASTLGASPLPPLDRVDLDVLRRTYEVNLVAPLALVQTFVGALEPGGAVVNITSDAAVEAYEGWGGYGSSKAALEQASRVLAVEHPEWRVLVVDPGDMRTEMHQDAFPGEDIGDRPLPQSSVPGLVALIEGGQPSGRYEARALPASGSGPAPVPGGPR